MNLPKFNLEGGLPPGDYLLTFDQLRESILVLGPGDPAEFPNWDAKWRHHLTCRAEILIRELWQVGIDRVFLDGSFVEDKDHPKDIDGYFECSSDELRSGRLQARLNRINPLKIWTWDPRSRRPYRGDAKRQLPMWHSHRVELYPHATGIYSGICDEWGNDLEFPAAFRRSRRDGSRKGIVQIVREPVDDSKRSRIPGSEPAG